MKKRIVILSLSLLLTGCQAVTDTAGKTESSFSETELVENTENEMIEKSEIPEEIIEEVSEEVAEEVSEEVTGDDSEEAGEVGTTAEEEDELDYTVTVLDKHMDITDTVPASDLVTLQCEFYEDDDESAIFFAYVEDGKLYYSREMNRGYLYYSGRNSSMEILPEISNIRRMKTFNAGSGVDPMPVLITESGEVYMLYNTWPRYSDEMELVRFTLLEDYQVEDILYFSGEWSYHMKVLLKDGSVIELQSESWG
ncbi:MAG: hypothetical protein IKL06_03525 [Lachnospiraceae bacterium]|nr:hypothetical protein [Lachnospiraceae bacterium]